MTRWLKVADKYLGTREVKGAKHNPVIVKWWAAIRAPFADDETPWCAAFVGGVLEEAGLKSSRSASARSYQKWGADTDARVGAVVVLWRGTPQSATGHVGFLVGRDVNNNLMILGGNQGDEVSIKPFPRSRLVCYRWPSGAGLSEPMPFPGFANLPLLSSDGKISTNEA